MLCGSYPCTTRYLDGVVRTHYCAICHQVIPPGRPKEGTSVANGSEDLYLHSLWKRDIVFYKSTLDRVVVMEGRTIAILERSKSM
jgi:hypothetical protein